MVLGTQVAGVLVMVFLLYMTFLYYKKNIYTRNEFLFWCAAWLGGALLLIFPDWFTTVAHQLKFVRATDLYMAIAIAFFAVITFLNYTKVRNQERKVEELVRNVAIRKRK